MRLLLGAREVAAGERGRAAQLFRPPQLGLGCVDLLVGTGDRRGLGGRAGRAVLGQGGAGLGHLGAGDVEERGDERPVPGPDGVDAGGGREVVPAAAGLAGLQVGPPARVRRSSRSVRRSSS